jgi:truncated hemoglobin YjbI
MATEKTFDCVGTSNLFGNVKMRYANGLAARVKVLKYHGHTEIELHQLPHPMTKEDAKKWYDEMKAQAAAEAEPEDMAEEPEMAEEAAQPEMAEEPEELTNAA